MQTLTAKLQTVTPMFLGGAEQSEAELRPPSIKGALRFWYRATDPDYKTHIDGKTENPTWEEKIFGSSKYGQGECLIRVFPSSIQTTSILDETQALKYLGYGAVGENRKYIKPDGVFTLTLGYKSQEVKDKLVKTLQTMVLFGGLGSRSRRGFGSLELLECLDIPWQGLAKDVRELKERCREFLVEAGTVERRNDEKPEYTSFSQNQNCIFKVCSHTSSTWKQALEQVGNKMIEYRKNNYKGERYAFGLPHIDFFTDNARRGSPLFIRIHQLETKKYLVLLACFPAFFHPDKEDVNWSVIQDFIDIC